MSDEILPPTSVPPHEHDTEKVIADTAAKILGERKVRFADRRLQILFVLLILILGGLGAQQKHLRSQQQSLRSQQQQQDSDRRKFEAAERVLCYQINAIIVKNNSYVDQLSVQVERRTNLTPTEKQALLRTYAQSHLPELGCADLPGG
jgi:uncharacterized protein HemX